MVCVVSTTASNIISTGNREERLAFSSTNVYGLLVSVVWLLLVPKLGTKKKLTLSRSKERNLRSNLLARVDLEFHVALFVVLLSTPTQKHEEKVT